MPSGRLIAYALAYALAGIPAAIGVAFVARHAYVTSDTPDAGLGTAALFAMVAAGAFAGPACALAVANNGRKGWAVVFGFLALVAVAANWLNTLGAIAQRGAGTEASMSKAKEDTADARAELKRLQGELEKLGTFTPTDAAAVAAAKRAADAATAAKERECENGRGSVCRTRETAEQAASEKLATASANKAATDRAAKLEADMVPFRAHVTSAPATPTTNALGETLGRWLSLPAAAAVSIQQGFMALVVELLIAAALALPELLRPREEREPETVQGAVEKAVASIAPAAEPGSVRRFMLACLKRTKGEKAMRGAVYRRYQRWCDDTGAAPLPIPAFWEQFEPLCAKVGINLREREGKVYCVDVQLAA